LPIYIERHQKRRLALITHVKFVSISTKNQDAALAFYTEKLGFKLVTDQPYDDKQRWIELRIGSSDTRFVLFDMDEHPVGASFNGALACDNVEKTYLELKERGVKFMGPPQTQPWGSFAVFEDPDANKFVLSSR
jgi:catechol 2,3-dioxygenase-like lactoylglutathione lyase family enzyme